MDRAAIALRGRERELAVLASIFARTLSGGSGTLVVTGEAGIGKSALLATALQAAPDELRIERATAAESEMELPYAGLHQLTAGLAHASTTLPENRQTPRSRTWSPNSMSRSSWGRGPGSGASIRRSLSEAFR